ncbi:coiled-coil domain-containing protein 159 [Cervus elaphus]|uniref:coiled-coil domain-containing protein 159 n=1 Tax=Cervus canadensis TaxID=1574408 RepID=UPI001C9E757B|nr:coiled-coil domain-containing protein 159 [Cervus canadensis]XP_043767530.1 coiled-coil domain-containing protein 159 [Cervus elaphus]
MSRCNPLLAGLPLDPEYSVPCYRSLPSSSNVCSPAHKKCDKCCGSCSPAHKKCDKCCGSCSPAHKKCDKCCGSCSPAHKKCDKCCGSCSPAHKKCDKCCGTSSEKTSEYTFHWSKNPEPETSQPTAPENTVTAEAWRPGRDTGCQSHGSPSTPCSDSQEPCNDQDLPKSHNSNTKTLLMPFAPKEEGHYLSPSRSEGSEAVCSQGHPPCLPQRCTSERVQAGAEKPLETSCSKTKVKSTTMIPDCQKLLRCELESLKCQLQAQTKAFEFLNHSVTLLEKESCLQQIKIQQLEEVLGPASHQGDKEGHKWDVVEGRQELYEALAQGLQGLQKTLHDNEEVQWARTTRCLQLLAQEIRDSKKFLWEELELVREEVTFIYQKLQAQEQEITENLVNIQKMQKTQVKCRKVLTKMKQQGYETANWLETEELPPGCSGSWRDNLQKELGDIWSAVHVLQNSFDGLAISSGGRPRAANLRGYKGHRCLSPPLPCWDSDSDTDQGPPQLLLSKSHSSFPPA